MLQQLASFPGLKTGRGYSAVVLDRFQARPALLRFSGMLGGAWERGYLSSCSSSTPCFLLCPGLTQPVLHVFAVLFQQRTGSGVTFDSTFLVEARLLFAWVTSMPHDGTSTIDPRSFTLRTSISTLPLALDLLQEHGCEKYKCISKFFTTRLPLFNEYEILRYDVRIHIHIHTYIQTPLAFNTLVWGSLRLAPIKRWYTAFCVQQHERTDVEICTRTPPSSRLLSLDCVL